MADHLSLIDGYNPYEWFDPEMGRRECQMMFLHAGRALGSGLSTGTARLELFNVAGVDKLSAVPLHRLGATIRKFRSLGS